MPIDNPVLPSYIINTPDPSDALRKNLALALQVGQAGQQAQSTQDAHAAAQQEAQLKGVQIQGAQQGVNAAAIQQQRTQALRDAWAKESQNPTPQGMTRILTQFPEAAEMVQKAGGALDEQQVRVLTQIVSAMLTKHPDIAKSEIEKAATAWDDPKNGNPQRAQQLRDMSKRYDADPGGTTMNNIAALATSMGVPKFAETFSKLMGIPTEQARADADLITAQNAAKAGAPAAANAQQAYDLEQRQKKIAADQAAQTLTTLPDKVQDSVGQLTKEANEARNISGRIRSLIAKGETMVNSGKASSFVDFIKDIYGGQDKTNDVRNQIEGFMGSSVMGQLANAGGKGGEAIVGLGQQGVPGKYDDMKSVVLPYLRRLADAADRAAPLALDSARWQTIARGVQPAPRDFPLPSGRKVTKGDFYDSLAKSALPAVPDSSPSAPWGTAQNPFTDDHAKELADLERKRKPRTVRATTRQGQSALDAMNANDPRGQRILSQGF